MASYSFTTTAAQEAAITDARTRYNNTLPLGQADPGAFAANGQFMLNVVTNAVASWDAVSVRPSLTVGQKNAVVTLLNADVARADANSATAQALLNQINAAT